jgi:hypothetical protein
MKIKRKNLNSLANCLAYHVQDVLDNISHNKFSLKHTEKHIKKVIIAYTKNGKPLVKSSK